MEVYSKIQPQSYSQNSFIEIKNNFNKNNKPVSFSSNRAEVQTLSKLIRKSFLQTQAWYVRLAEKFSESKYSGDITNVIITGLGTGLVAPFMIKNNPLSKEDQDTKTYAAWRQPISAVIAVVSQVGITMNIRKIIDKMASEGRLGYKLDTRTSDAFMKEVTRLKEKYTNPKIAAANDTTVNKISERIDALKTQAEAITNRVMKFREVSGIGLALITLPIACGLLNWVYPKFMKLAFPKLNENKAQKTEKNNNHNIPDAKKLNLKAGS